MAARIAALLLVILTCSAAADPAAQGKQKPAFAINTRAIEGSVTVEPELRSHPRLYEKLLAAGKRELNTWRRQANKDFKDMPEAFGSGRKYEFERVYRLRSTAGPYLSISRLDYIYALGAHPNHNTNTILWDTKAKKAVSIRPLFKESTSNGPTLVRLAHAIRMKAAAEKRARDIEVENADTDPMLSQIKPDLLHMGAVALVPSTEPNRSAGLIFYFSPYDIGSYVEGDYSAFVPWRDFKDDLSPAGQALFGGDRPAGDEQAD